MEKHKSKADISTFTQILSIKQKGSGKHLAMIESFTSIYSQTYVILSKVNLT